MRTLRTAIVAGSLVAAVASTLAPASASTGGQCNGSVDYGCTYCSYRGGAYGQDPYRCSHPTQYPGYITLVCTVWASNQCVVG